MQKGCLNDASLLLIKKLLVRCKTIRRGSKQPAYKVMSHSLRILLSGSWILFLTCPPSYLGNSNYRRTVSPNRKPTSFVPRYPYSRFSHDITKIQMKELSILLNFYFHEVVTAAKHLYLNKVLVLKGSLFCNRGHLTTECSRTSTNSHLFWQTVHTLTPL